METPFETALGTGKNDFGHGLSTEIWDCTLGQVRSADGAYIGLTTFLAIRAATDIP